MSTSAMAPPRPTPAPIVSDRQAAAFAVLGTAPRAAPLSRSVTVILDRERLGRYGLAGARLALATLAAKSAVEWKMSQQATEGIAPMEKN